MLTILFFILLVYVFGKLFLFALKAAWGLAQLILTVICLPLVLIGLVVAGLVKISLPILIVIGVISLLWQATQEV